ncbi:type 2 isopentenyl-diphosphate Delta-isomerase [Lactobacillus johnsonii]|uniref:type 2 isopentenyl-diphosphate Delta-isomerase n=1 Tax=Lactobacillus johnsonii TaxID=33959 RepID=UPI0028EF243E|nr:type 2 isopentenyl-diphosphate Delta-isomerase [Lactobacillus johnsonii]MDT9605455.1 type 2 isopentenyl-diphosphate Delta-isomerase [Lactobacillus johnsonii]
MSQRSQRKEEHLALAKMFFNSNKDNDFNHVHLIRPALPESAVNKDSISTEMFGHKISAPFFINAMTGGSDTSYTINQRLAKAAAAENIPMALGSASILEKEIDQIKSFEVARQENPDGLIFANVNPTTDPKVAQRIVDALDANALQIHLNSVQEAVMPEGDRDFHWIDNLKEIRDTVDVPIIIKEVGMGIDPESLRTLLINDFSIIDLGGSGGTNFAQIENERRKTQKLNFLEDIGLSTVKTLLAARTIPVNKTIIAAGGITNALDIFKSLVLGAQYVGIANYFLQYASQDSETLIAAIQNLKYELKLLTALFGLDHISKADEVKYYLDTDLYNFTRQLYN